MKKYTITAALPYANGPLHIGHIAGSYLPADMFVRFLRLRGENVVFICGSDEHGAAITIRAKKEGTTPQAIVDTYHSLNKETFAKFDINFDMYHRTSAPIHHQTAQDYFIKLHEKGEFVEKISEQYFDEEHQQFLADRYIIGTCPKCGYDSAYGDQCEKCGSSLNATDLINPRSTLSNKTPILKTTKHWYLSLDKYQEWLEQWILVEKEGKWKNNVYGQCKSWLKAGLQPRAMTRDLDWGVDVPLEGADGKKLYVWLDAPIGYISATKQWAMDRAVQNPEKYSADDWKQYWEKQENEEDNATLIHFLGKDNIVFHCIIFPAILRAHGDYILPENVPANEFLNLEGDKISTSRNWAVWLHEYLAEFPDKRDELRYALGSILPENKDSEFTWGDFQSRNNNELVKVLGNFVNRVVVLMNKYFDGVVPDLGNIAEDEAAMDAFKQIHQHVEALESAMENFRFRDALAEFMNVARVGNKYITEQEPWKKWKTDQDSVKRSLYTCLQITAQIGVLAKIFLPDTSASIFQYLQVDGKDLNWDALAVEGLVQTGHTIQQGKAKLLFEPIQDKTIQKQIDKLEASKGINLNVAKPKEEISFDDFQKMDIRIGTILEASKVKKADKLLQFTVDVGFEKRTIVSGVAKFFEPEELIGKQVPVLVNLKPRKIRGVMSQGMILFAEDTAETLHLLSTQEDIESGSEVN